MSPIRSLRSWALAGIVVVLAAAPVLRADPYEESIKNNFFLPDLIRQTHEMIGLTEDQQSTLLAAMQDVQERMAGLKENLEKEKTALAEMVKGERLDEKAVTAQAQKVMDLENKAKLVQLELLIKIKNTLTHEQQAKLREGMGKRAEMEGKLKQAMALADRIKDAGGDLSSLQDAKQQFDDLVQQGKMDEAAVLLDKTLKTLQEKAGTAK